MASNQKCFLSNLFFLFHKVQFSQKRMRKTEKKIKKNSKNIFGCLPFREKYPKKSPSKTTLLPGNLPQKSRSSTIPNNSGKSTLTSTYPQKCQLTSDHHYVSPPSLQKGSHISSCICPGLPVFIYHTSEWNILRMYTCFLSFKE